MLWHDLPDALGHDSAPLYLVVALPVAGAALVAAARTLLPGDGGSSPREGMRGARTRGAADRARRRGGMAAAPLLRAGEREQGILAAAGSFSAISALFGGPIVVPAAVFAAAAAWLTRAATGPGAGAGRHA